MKPELEWPNLVLLMPSAILVPGMVVNGFVDTDSMVSLVSAGRKEEQTSDQEQGLHAKCNAKVGIKLQFDQSWNLEMDEGGVPGFFIWIFCFHAKRIIDW